MTPPSNSETTSTFKYEQWADDLRQKIQSGLLMPGDRLPSHGAMKEQFGLSRPTVERIHALLESEGLIVREERRGAFVASRGAAVSRIIGVFSPLDGHREHQPYNVTLLAGVRDIAERMDHQILLLGNSATDGGRRPDWTQLGGILTLATDEGHLTGLLNALPPGMPCVTLIGESPRALSITCDDYHGAMAATEHLLELGHRRVAALISPITLVTRRRIEGYRQALHRAGITAPATWLHDQDYRLTAERGFAKAAHESMAAWLRKDWRKSGCTAIVTQNDESAIGVIEALQEAGLRVPEDVSVVGFDGTELAHHFRPRLTTLQVPLHEIGERGAKWLIDQMQASRDGTWSFEKASRETIALLPRLRSGESSGPPPKSLS